MHRVWSRYALALAVTAAAILLRAAADPWLGDVGPLILSSAAILLAALFGGFGPGIVALGLGAAAAMFLYMEPRYSFAVADSNRTAYLVFFAGIGIIFCVVGELFRRNQSRLRTAKDRYSTLFDTIQDGFCIVRMIYDDAGKPIDYHFVEGNPALSEHTGTTDPIGRNMRDIEPNIEPFWIETYGRIAQTGVAERFESHVRAWDRWFDVYAYRFGDPTKHEVAIFFKDISARKKTQRALAEAKLRVEAGLMAGEVATYSWDIRGDCLRGDRNFARLFGVMKDENDSAPLDEFVKVIHPDDVPRVQDALRATLEHRQPYEVEYRILRSGGSPERWVLARGEVVERDAEGAPLMWTGVLMDITQRKRAEQELRASQETFKQLLTLMPAAVYSCDTSGVITYFNEQAAQTWGRTPKIGDTDDRFCGSEQLILPNGTVLPHDKCPMAVALRDGRSFRDVEVGIRRPDGSVVQVVVNIDPIRNEKGEIIGAINAFHDVTAIKQAETLLRASQATFQQLVENSPFGVFIVDADFRMSVVSAGARKTFVNVKPLIGRDLAEVMRAIWPEPAATEFIEIYRHTLATGEPYHSPATVEQRADIGQTEEYDWRLERIRTPDGRYGVVCYFYDLSERQRLEAALRESERHFRAVFEQTAAGIAEVDTAGRFIRVNKTYCEIVGRSPHDLLTLHIQDITHPEDAPANAEQFVAIVRGQIDDFLIEKRYVRPDGTPIWVRKYVSGIRDEAGKVQSVIVVADDITDRKELDDRKDQFLAVLSHELRNPLAAIRMAAKVLEGTQNMPSPAEEMVGIVNRQTTQLVRLVDDLLDMNRISRGTFQLHPQVIDLDSVLHRAMEAADSSKKCYAISIEIHKPDKSLQVNADPLRLSQVFSNLIGNACKYSKPGSKVDIIIERDDPAAVIRVRDTGVGIPPNRIDKIFEMFAQVDPDRDRRTGGLGIGLALARGIVLMHGGTIEAHSEGEDKGSEFIVRLPLAQPRELPAVAVHSNGQVEAKPSKPRRILAVDDNIDALEGLAGVLRSAGHDVLTAVDGPTALSLAAAHKPEAALLDIGMPGMDGYELAQHIRSTHWGRDLTLIALTGWGQDKDKTRATEAGFNAHLTKPADIESIEQALAAQTART